MTHHYQTISKTNHKLSSNQLFIGKALIFIDISSINLNLNELKCVENDLMLSRDALGNVQFQER